MSTIYATDPTGGAVYEKWGEAARAGFQAVPDLLFKHQDDLKLNPTELVVLLNVLMHWWYRNQKPFPRPTTIARRMGRTVRTVQRAIAKLETEGLLVRQMGQNKMRVLDPDPLVHRLSELAKNDRDYLVRTGGFVA
jgi:helix-turn-helix protein